jgi:import inner membrane translocase subunit TIM22
MTAAPADVTSSSGSNQSLNNESRYSAHAEHQQVQQKKSIYEIMMMSSPSHQSSSHPNYVSSPVQPNFYSYEKALAAAPAAVEDSSPPYSVRSRSTTNSKLSYLPYHLPWTPIAGPTEAPVDFNWVTESCGAKAAIGVFGGGVMGLLMGVFLGAMSDLTPPVSMIHGREVPQAPIREQMRMTFRATADKSMYWCRNFAFITGVFSGSECLVEKARGTHDVWNEVISGCITGAAMQAKSGPQAAALGCGGFAAFSLAIAKVMGTH